MSMDRDLKKESEEFLKQFSELYSEISPYNKFAFDTGDCRALVLVLHLYVEHWMEELLREALGKPEIILESRELRTFDNKLKLIEALELNMKPETVHNIRLLNRIRNDCAHVLDKKQVHDAMEHRLREMNVPPVASSVPGPDYQDLPAYGKVQLIAILAILDLFYIAKDLNFENNCDSHH